MKKPENIPKIKIPRSFSLIAEKTMHIVQIDGETLTIEDVVKVAYNEARVVIPEKVKARVKACREFLEKFLEKAR